MKRGGGGIPKFQKGKKMKALGRFSLSSNKRQGKHSQSRMSVVEENNKKRKMKSVFKVREIGGKFTAKVRFFKSNHGRA